MFQSSMESPRLSCRISSLGEKDVKYLSWDESLASSLTNYHFNAFSNQIIFYCNIGHFKRAFVDLEC